MLVDDNASTLKDRLERMEGTHPECPAVKRLIEFIKANPNRPLSLPSEMMDFRNSGGNEKDAERDAG